MNKETIDSIKELLVPVAQKIGETAEWGWAVVVKQMYVEAVLGLFWASLGAIAILLIIKTRKWFVGQLEDSDGVSMMVWIFLLGIALAAFIAGSIFAITHFINPEFYAIQFFLNLVQ